MTALFNISLILYVREGIASTFVSVFWLGAASTVTLIFNVSFSMRGTLWILPASAAAVTSESVSLDGADVAICRINSREILVMESFVFVEYLFPELSIFIVISADMDDTVSNTD